mgnify:CR=1 FL=1
MCEQRVPLVRQPVAYDRRAVESDPGTLSGLFYQNAVDQQDIHPTTDYQRLLSHTNGYWPTIASEPLKVCIVVGHNTGGRVEQFNNQTLFPMNTLKNRVHLIGNLGFDPEVREIAKGRKVARLSVATNETYKNAAGERVTDTQWHTVVAWGATAEAVERMLRKGMPLALEGKLVHRSYETKDGQKRYITEVVMSDFQLLAKRAEAA